MQFLNLGLDKEVVGNFDLVLFFGSGDRTTLSMCSTTDPNAQAPSATFHM